MPMLSERVLPHLRRAALTPAGGPELTDGCLLTAFVLHQEPTAFEALVRRHGPMVLGVCRRVIGHTQTAEDAFQAVFVVLARKAATVQPREQLANWLFGVAYRTALKARSIFTRRRSREKQVDVMPEVAASPDELWTDIQPILDEELAALPERLRLPVVLCDLEGRPQREAARQLNLPPATLANRLSAARRRLAERLSARGVALSGGLFATLVGGHAVATVPLALREAAAGAGLSAIGSAAGVIPESVLQLSDGVLRMMLVAKLKAVSAVLLAGFMLLGGLGVGTLPHAFAQPAPQPVAKPRLGPTLTDAEFLKRTCETLRGSPASSAELGYFVADPDTNKRKKVVAWLTEAAAEGKADLRNLKAPRDSVRDARIIDNFIADEANSIHRFDRVMEHYLDQRTLNAQLDDKHELQMQGPGKIQLWAVDRLQIRDGKDRVRIWDVQNQPRPKADQPVEYRIRFAGQIADSDEDFLNKATHEARDTPPTKLEREYFLADKDTKKREKLLDLLLTDPAVAKKVGPKWKAAMLNPPQNQRVVFAFSAGADWSKLIGELTAAKKSDEQILEALTLVIVGRLPTGIEKQLVMQSLANEKDKTAAWTKLAGTLAGTDEAKKHAEKLQPNQPYRILLSGELQLNDRQLHIETAPAPKNPEPKK